MTTFTRGLISLMVSLPEERWCLRSKHFITHFFHFTIKIIKKQHVKGQFTLDQCLQRQLSFYSPSMTASMLDKGMKILQRLLTNSHSRKVDVKS